MSSPVNDSMKTILFSFSVLHAPREILPVVEYFLEQGWNVSVLLSFYGEVSDKVQEHCVAAGATVYHTPRKFAYTVSHKSSNGTPPTPCKKRMSKLKFQKTRRLLNILFDLYTHYRNILSIKQHVNKMLEQIHPDVIVCNNFQSCGKIDDILVHVCTEKKIPMFCVLCSPLIGKKISQQGRLNHLRAGMLPPENSVCFDSISRAIAKMFPQWTFAKGDEQVFMFDPILLLAARCARILPEDIWQCPSILFKSIFIHSSISYEILEQSNYPMDKVVLSGPPRLDRIFRSLADPKFVKSFWEELNSGEPEPYILWNVEPGFEHNYTTEKTHWDNFHLIYDCLKSEGIRVILSLHPLCQLSNYIFVENDNRFTISRTHGIESLYPFCKFAVSFPCSTSVYAKHFNKPLILYDWYGMRDKAAFFDEFYLSSGATLVSTPEELASALQVIITKTANQKYDTFFSDYRKTNASSIIYDCVYKN